MLLLSTSMVPRMHMDTTKLRPQFTQIAASGLPVRELTRAFYAAVKAAAKIRYKTIPEMTKALGLSREMNVWKPSPIVPHIAIPVPEAGFEKYPPLAAAIATVALAVIDSGEPFRVCKEQWRVALADCIFAQHSGYRSPSKWKWPLRARKIVPRTERLWVTTVLARHRRAQRRAA